MKKSIVPGTQLFLFNLQSKKLIGTFVSLSLPALNLEPRAFGGKFTAHVRVGPLNAPLLEAQLPQRPPTGPQSAAQVKALQLQLEQGAIAEGALQNWDVPDEIEEQPVKKLRSDAPLPIEETPQEEEIENSEVSAQVANDGAGYIFLCSNSTLSEIHSLRVFGLPDRELPKMKEIIKPGTQLFLFNMQTQMLMGTFVASATPAKGVAKGAFKGKFNAQVSVAAESPLFEVLLKTRIPSGPLQADQVAALQAELQKGQLADSKLQEAWNVAMEALDQDACEDVCESAEDGSVVKLPVVDKALRGLAPEARKDLEEDLAKLKADSGVSIELHCLPTMDEDSLVLRGEPEEVKSIQEWLQSILPFYDVDLVES